MRTPIWPAAAAVLLLSAPCLLAAPKEMRRPPVGDTIPVEVARGGRAVIALKAYEGRNNPLAYEIVRQPRHGRLVEFRQADVNRQGFASVVYQHDDGETSYEDEFAFKARAEGGGVSSPIAVKIRIIDQPPRLAAPSRVDFSAVAGESDFRIVGLTNAGGAVLEGRLAPEEPFYVEGDGRFRLGRGESVDLSVRFSPKSVDAVRPQKLTPSRADPGGVIVLGGEAKAPFAAEADDLEVQADGSRAGRIVVTNFCSYPLKLSLQLQPEGVAELVSERKIAAGGTAEIPVRIGSDKKSGALDFRVRLADEFHALELPMLAPAVPPKLELLTPELDFRRSDEAVLEVQNMGGVAGRFTFELPPQLQALDGATSFEVAGGESKSTRLLRRNTIEPAADTLVVDLGRGGRIPVPLLFPTPSPTPTPAPTPTPTPSPTPGVPKPWKLNEDVKSEKSADEKVRVTWVAEKDGWTDATLEFIDADGARPYPPEVAAQGWWQWAKSLWQWLIDWWSGHKTGVEKAWEDGEKTFRDRMTVPGEEVEDAPKAEPAKAERRSVEILPQDLQNPALRWRLIARDEDSGSTVSVSEDFVPDLQRALLVAVEQQSIVEETIPTSEPEDSPTPDKTTPTSARESAERRGAGRKVYAAAVVPERTRATVNIAIESDPEITGYRFERCEMVSEIDPATGIPLRPTYEAIKHDGTVSILGVSPAEHEGTQLSVVVATIDGLQAGTATMWRLVPLAGEESLTPTGEFLVPTKHPWRPPWRTIFLGLLFAVLATVLWLRQKQEKV